jgi:hypothetical protein
MAYVLNHLERGLIIDYIIKNLKELRQLTESLTLTIVTMQPLKFKTVLCGSLVTLDPNQLIKIKKSKS